MIELFNIDVYYTVCDRYLTPLQRHHYTIQSTVTRKVTGKKLSLIMFDLKGKGDDNLSLSGAGFLLLIITSISLLIKKISQ